MIWGPRFKPHTDGAEIKKLHRTFGNDMLAIDQQAHLKLLHLVSFERDVHTASKICVEGPHLHTNLPFAICSQTPPFHFPSPGQPISLSSLSPRARYLNLCTSPGL